MRRAPIREINAEFPAEARYLEQLQNIAKEACGASGMDRKMTTAVLLAVEEGATNVIRHAYLYDKGTVRLRVVIYRKFVVFSLIDTGRSFTPPGKAISLEKLVETGRKGGLGFYMIQKIMDSVEYFTVAGVNELRMLKRLEPQNNDSPPLLRRLTTLRAKFSIYTFGIMAIIIGAAYLYVDDRTTNGLTQHFREVMTALGSTVADQASGFILNQRSDVEFDELIVSYRRANPDITQLVLTNQDNQILAHSDDIGLIRRDYSPPQGLSLTLFGEPQPVGDGSRYYLVLPIGASGNLSGRVHMTYSTLQLRRQISEARARVASGIALLALIGIAGIYLLSSYFVDPIVKISQRVRKFSAGDVTTELPLEGADEFLEISSALNEMMTRVNREQRLALERERVNKEIELTSQIQKTLLPSVLPAIPGFSVDCYYQASSLVGGDLYDLFKVGDRYCLVVADVSGKGLPAAMVMSMLRTVLQIYAETCGSLRETVLRADEYLQAHLPTSMFITAIVGFLNPATREFEYVCCGHTPLIQICTKTGELQSRNPGGMPMGVPRQDKSTFGGRLETSSITFHPGEIVLLYTDGITDAVGRDGERYGQPRLEEELQRLIKQPIGDLRRDLVAPLIETVESFSGRQKQVDDLTLLTIQAS